jgi:hypothetical protein
VSLHGGPCAVRVSFRATARASRAQNVSPSPRTPWARAQPPPRSPSNRIAAAPPHAARKSRWRSNQRVQVLGYKAAGAVCWEPPRGRRRQNLHYACAPPRVCGRIVSPGPSGVVRVSSGRDSASGHRQLLAGAISPPRIHLPLGAATSVLPTICKFIPIVFVVVSITSTPIHV